MHNLVPHFIQRKFAQGIYRGEFDSTGLFVDMSGFSKMTDTLMTHGPHGAEVMASVMGKIFTPLAECIFSQGGFIAGFAGDAFTALFPLDAQDHENYARLLAAAWQIQQYMTRISIQKTPYGNYTIQAKIGLGDGSSRWGIVPSLDGKRAVYYFQGASVDGSAGAEHLAAGGQIVLTSSVYNRLQELIDAEPVVDHYCLTGVRGTLLDPRPVLPVRADPEIVSHFYPNVRLDQIRGGEFRYLVSLFINLPTVRDETQLNAFMQTVFELLDHYGGMTSKLDFGDKGSNLLLFWGMPVTYENDVERALNFVLGLQSMTSIPVNAGLTYQIAHAGFIGSPYLEDFTGYGRGVSLAARFMTQAARGEIWVDESIYRRARNMFEFDDLGARTFKGFSEAQSVYVLIERSRQAEPFFSGQMFGRGPELECLADFYRPVCTGAYAGALVISGEAGIGKSRLVHEFQKSGLCREDDALWALCQTDEILRAPLNPFRYWLQNYFGQADIQPEARNKRNFNRAIDELILKAGQINSVLAGDLDRLRSCLGALVNLHWSDSLYEQLDPQGRYDNILIALIDLLLAESLNRTVVLFIEDVQWLDPVSLEFLPRLNRRLTADKEQPYPLAIIATTRPEGSSEVLGAGFNYEKIDLSGMSTEDLASLAQSTLNVPPAPRLLDLMQRRSEGNPFYAEQILRYLQEQECLMLVNGKMDVRGDSLKSLLPVDVGAILVARLDRLTEQVRNVVQTASILGREFEVQILVRMLKSEETLFQDISIAASAAIWKPLDEIRYIFNHFLMQNAAYHMLLLAQRQELHALAVTAIETLYAVDLVPHFGELAYHSEQATLADKACFYLEQAADAARDAYQNQAAIDYYSRALALTGSQDLLARFRLMMEIVALYYLLGDLDSQKGLLQEISGIANALDVSESQEKAGLFQAQVLERWAAFYLQQNDYPRAVSAAEEAVESALAMNDLLLAIKASAVWSTALDHQGRFDDAFRSASETLELAAQLGDRHEQGRALNLLGLISWEQNQIENACRYLGQALQISDEESDRRLQAMSLGNLSIVEAAEGDYAAARAYNQESVRIDYEIGDRIKLAVGLNNLGWINGMLGDYSAARSYGEQNMLVTREIGDRRNESYTLINLSGAAGRQGDYIAAVAFAEQALSLARTINDPSAEAWALTYLGHAGLGAGQLESARQAYESACQIREKLSQPNLACEPIAGLARLALVEAELTTSARRVGDILAYLDGGGTLAGSDEPMRVYQTCYQVLTALHDPGADTILETAYRLLQEQALKISDSVLRQSFLENVPYHREIILAWANRS